MANVTGPTGVALTLAGPRWALLGLVAVPVWILFGNSLVLLAVFWNKHLRTLSNYVIASLAGTDLLLAVIVVPLGTYYAVNGRWDLGLVPCLIWTGSDVMLSTASILHLGAIAIHRYLGISYPLYFRNNGGKCHILALLVPAWGISVVIAIPLIIQGILYQEHVLIDMGELGVQCGIFDHVFVIYSSAVSFFLPLTVMIFVDVRSVQILRATAKVALESRDFRKRYHRSNGYTDKQMDSGGQQSLTQVSTLISPSPDLEPSSDSKSMPTFNLELTSDNSGVQQVNANLTYIGMLSTKGMSKFNTRERRAEKTLIWVFVCFVVLWLPFFCTNLTYGLCQMCDIPGDLFMSFTWLGYISSGVNPCIYTFLNKDFRVAFKQIINCAYNKRTQYIP